MKTCALQALGVVGFVALVAISGCTPSALDRNPTAWEPVLADAFAKQPYAGQCAWLRQMRANGVTLTAADKAMIEPAMMAAGLTPREIAYAEAGAPSISTGDTYRQVVCHGGTLINDAFYSGTGHQWQMRVGSSYVYLEGDGTEGGMRVTGWN